MSQPSNTSPSGRPGAELSEAGLDQLVVHERSRVVAPLTEWHTLATALRHEGLVRSTPATEQPSAGYRASVSSTSVARQDVPVRQRGTVARWITQGIAAVLLLGSGVVIGRGLTVGNDVAQAIRAGIQADSVKETLGILASDRDDDTFESATQARRALARSQGEYLRAAAYLAANAGTKDSAGARLIGDPELYQQRLAALDEMANVTKHALKGAPHDPVLNQYYQSTVGAREATMQQLDQSLPVGVQLSRY